MKNGEFAAARTRGNWSGRYWVAAVALLAGAALHTLVHAQLPPAESYQGVEYVSGGFGSDNAEAFKAAQAQYPLALTFAAADEDGGSRPYVADVHVVVKDDNDTVVLDAPSVGPYLLAKLQPGNYEVAATYLGETQTRRIQVKDAGSARETITWKRR